MCKVDFGAESKEKGGIESGGGRGGEFEVAGVQAVALILRRFLLHLPPRAVDVGERGGGDVGGGVGGDGGSAHGEAGQVTRSGAVVRLLAMARSQTCAPRAAVLVVSSLALAAEFRAPSVAPGGAAGQAWVQVSAEALREAVGVVAMVDRSCRHTPLQMSLHTALLRLLAASTSPSVSAAPRGEAGAGTHGGVGDSSSSGLGGDRGMLRDILALVGCIPEVELDLPATALKLGAWLASLDRPGEAAGGRAGEGGGEVQAAPASANGMVWINRQLAEHVHEYLLVTSAEAGGAGTTGGKKEGLPDESDVALIESKARVLARLMVLSTAEMPAAGAGSSAWQVLGQRLLQLCSHAYLPWSAHERAVALVHQLVRTACRTHRLRLLLVVVCVSCRLSLSLSLSLWYLSAIKALIR